MLYILFLYVCSLHTRYIIDLVLMYKTMILNIFNLVQFEILYVYDCKNSLIKNKGNTIILENPLQCIVPTLEQPPSLMINPNTSPYICTLYVHFKYQNLYYYNFINYTSEYNSDRTYMMQKIYRNNISNICNIF